MSTSPPSIHQQRKLQSAERAKMVHHQRYNHQLKKGLPFLRKEDEKDDEESQTLVLDFGSSTANYYKRTTPKLMFFYFLFLFSFLSCCLVFGPQLFTLYTNDGLVDSENFVPICSSIASGTMCCDRSNIRSDICYMKGDVRTQSSTSSIILYSSDGVNNGVVEDDVSEVEEEEEAEEEIQHEKIKPYTRKWEKSVMDTIDELDLIVKKSTSRNKDHCDVMHSVPAVVFSTGGYTGNVYHEFNDGIIPLYITSQHLNKEVVFVLLEYHEWWITKYTNIVSHLSNYPVIDFSGDNRTHCFPEVIVGCRIHDELTIDPALMPGNKSIKDFHNLLDRAYWPRINGLIHDEEEQSQTQLKPKPKPKPRQLKKPKLVVVSRNGSRAITNEDLMVEMAKEIGFEVDVLRPDRTSELAKIYRALNSSDMMIGVHGAAMTHFLFMRPGSVFIQVVPLGTDWAAESYYGDPAIKLGLKYIGYKILPRESSLYGSYHKDDPVLKDPESVNAKGWEYTKKIYLDGQNVKLELGRFRKRLVRAYEYLSQKDRRHGKRHLR